MRCESRRELRPPFVCRVVSGGHTHLVLVKDYGEFEIVGRTRDDAAGEAFDKVARAVGLGYPGGPKVDKAAREGDPAAIHFPRGEVEGSPYDFTFSGLKSSVLNYINKCRCYPPDASPLCRGLFLLRSNKVPGYPPDAKHHGRVGFLLRSNKVPGYLVVSQ